MGAMTDLYEALRAAMTPDGRVRMTRELLTAMHEEGALRASGVAPSESAFDRGYRSGYAEADRDTLDAMAQPHGTPIGVALALYREKFAALMRERAETAERERDEAQRELDGAEREADEQRERRKRAEIERDAAHARAETAERELAEMRADRDSWRQQADDARSDALRYGRERDEALATGGRVLAVVATIRDVTALAGEQAETAAERELADALARIEAFERAAEAEQAAGST